MKLINKIRNDIIQLFCQMLNIHSKLYYVVEDANWSIKEDGKNIVNNMTCSKGVVVSKLFFFRKKTIVHLGSFNVLNICEKINKQKVEITVATCFHIVDSDERYEMLTYWDRYIDIWHTTCSLTYNKMIQRGIDAKKIKIIPLGVKLDVYYPEQDLLKRKAEKEKLGISDDYFVISSFQKDGNGWKDGNDPKMIKGPDVFCDVIEKLSTKYKIFVLLSGPARGYVMHRLGKAGVPYVHTYMKNANDVADLYRVSDCYLVTSREEGGPKAILEAMACGVPIVSTRVGMAVDIIRNEENGILCDSENLVELCCGVERIIKDGKLREKLKENGLRTSLDFDIKKIVQRYEMELYSFSK